MSIPGQRVSPEGMTSQTDALHRLWSRLDAPTQEYIKLYHARMRKANKEATEAWNKRQARLNHIKEYCRVNKYTEHGFRDKLLQDWAFNDANDDMKRWTREAERCWAAIQAELTLSIMRGL